MGGYQLKDGTIAVKICIARNLRCCPGTEFVFHFHPDAKKASADDPYASTGHFKPYDSAPKQVRVTAKDLGDDKVLGKLYALVAAHAKQSRRK